MSTAIELGVANTFAASLSLVDLKDLREGDRLRTAHRTAVRQRLESGDVRELVSGVLATLAPASNTSLFSVTLSHGDERSICDEVPRFGDRLEDRGDACILPLDRGERGHEHVHGLIASASSRVVLLSEWVAQTSADRRWQRCRGISGELGVAYALKYAFEPPKVGPERDLEREVWCRGALAPVYAALLEPDGLRVVPGSKTPQNATSRQQCVSTGVCAWCSRPIPPGRRSHTVTCRAGCRVSLCRARKRGAR